MLITCPECQFEREIDLSTIPASATIATCPHCNQRFRFRNAGEMEALENSPGLPNSENAEAGNARNDGPDGLENSFHAGGSPAPKKMAPPPDYPPATSLEGEDELPPGAVVPPIKLDDEKPKTHENIGKAASDGLLDWLKKLTTKAGNAPKGTNRSDGAQSQGAAGSEATVVPWEHMPYFGIFGGFYHTILRVMFQPTTFFANIRSNANPLLPLAFYIIMGVLQIVMVHFWYAPLQQIDINTTTPQAETMVGGVMGQISLPLLLLLSPFSLALQVVVLSSLFHLMFRLAQPEKANFWVVYRVLCYSTAPYIMCVVPVLGPYIASVWFLVTTFVGCKYALDLGWGRTCLALAPLFILGLAMLQFAASVQLNVV